MTSDLSYLKATTSSLSTDLTEIKSAVASQGTVISGIQNSTVMG
jgi:hypothetical protein